jgi:hypothetical protein
MVCPKRHGLSRIWSSWPSSRPAARRDQRPYFPDRDFYEAHDARFASPKQPLSPTKRKRLTPHHYFRLAEMRALFADCRISRQHLVIARRCAFIPQRQPILRPSRPMTG